MLAMISRMLLSDKISNKTSIAFFGGFVLVNYSVNCYIGSMKMKHLNCYYGRSIKNKYENEIEIYKRFFYDD